MVTKAQALLLLPCEPSTRSKRPPRRDDEINSGPVPKKSKTQSKNKDTRNSQPTIAQTSDYITVEPGSENLEVIEIDDEGLISDVEVIEAEENETAEVELERLKKEWNAPIYSFFQKNPIISIINDRRCHEFICSVSKCLGKGQNPRRVRRYLDKQDAKSTGNLHKHAAICWGEETVKQARLGTLEEVRKLISEAKETGRDGTITFAFNRIGKGKLTYSNRPHTKVESRLEAVRWVSESKRPFSIVHDHGFLRLMKTGRPHIWVPSPTTVARDVRKVFLSCQQLLAAFLQKYPGCLSFGTDAWTSPNNIPYMAVSAHLRKDGKPVSLLLDFVEVSKSHTGLNLALEFVEILKNFGIEKKLLAITCDNASNNDTMVTEMSARIDVFRGDQSRVRCLAHIINLVVKSILKQFDSRKVRNEISETEVVDTGGDNVEGWIEEVIDTNTRAEIEPVRLMLVKLRKVAYSIKNSTTILRPRWNKILAEQGLPVKMMPRDMATRWNSTYDMLYSATNYKSALKILLNDEDELNDYQLNKTEWSLADELCNALKVFKEATLFASRDTTSVAAIIPAMDRIHSLLSAQTTTSKFSSVVVAALRAGMKTFERYHNKTNISEVYRIATVLNPRHKLQYFKQSGREEGWIEESRAMVKIQWEASYASADTVTQVRNSTQVDLEPEQRNKDQNMFDFDFFDTSPMSDTAAQDELEHYLSTNAEPVTDPIEWWNSKLHTYPRLSCMAFDYLVIPATSVKVERIFSEGRSLLSHTRNRLASESTRALMCLGEWSISGFIKESDMLKVLKAGGEGSEDEIDMYEDEDVGTLFCD
ncbi:hypothetical protein Agabi119p4_5103 [Agaricus bisporus var. burnettii]|uniref:HAT C-terminal dimerisation domain-containing protein n=1 Tax=Agaricus bisporus var. burnettii TaxID=192524 RepID=A0A8H7F4M4_AGABI|nr:hypothetical protein Agabi119p4_5103 [Agaricus bisporus var. burnettii]